MNLGRLIIVDRRRGYDSLVQWSIIHRLQVSLDYWGLGIIDQRQGCDSTSSVEYHQLSTNVSKSL